MEDLKKRLVKNVKYEIARHGINQAKLADVLGKQPATVSRILREDSEFSAMDIASMCRFFNVSSDKLLGVKREDNLKDFQVDYTALANKLSIKGYNPHIFDTGSKAVEYVTKACKDKAVGAVGLGSAIAFQSIGLLESLDESNIKYYFASDTNKFEDGVTRAQKAINSQVFILTVAGLSYETARICVISADGNNLAGSSGFNKEVIYIIGKNKISSTLGLAIDNHKNGYVKMLVEMRGYDTPCAKGECQRELCGSDNQCTVECMYSRSPNKNSTVILIKESIGY